MIKKLTLFICLAALCSLYSFAQMSDKKATAETKNLYQNLHRINGKQVLFGHQDDLAYGVGWKYEDKRSDIKELSGEYPAVFGWDVSRLERDGQENLDGVPFEKMKSYIKTVYDMGAVNTISWHMDNPLNGKTAWDTTSAVTVKEMLPGGSVHRKYQGWLDRFAVFMKTLKGSDGKMIPILFRPFHEHGGSWFWWGKKECSPAEYKSLWKFTVTYLRDVQQVHNLLYVYNPCDFKTEAEYLERYPGDEYTDVLSFDAYQYGGVSEGAAFAADLRRKLEIQKNIADKSHKITAIAEMGYVEIPDPQWWSGIVWKAIEQYKPAWILVWRNAGYREQEKDNHYYAPYKGQTSAADFIQVVKEKKFLLQNGISKQKIYSGCKSIDQQTN